MHDILNVQDTRQLRAAEGWLELGNYSEAREELAAVSPSNKDHPEVLNVRWEIFSRARQWKACEDVARTLTALTPEQPLGWIHLAHALHKQHKYQEAYDTLLSVLNLFPKCPAIFYDLAVYGCRLQKLDEARAWLDKASSVSSHPKRIKLLARKDPLLKTLWQTPKT
jgi:predicted Zn-dependent protease